MKDIFDKCYLGDLKLNSHIIRTGTWETETEDGGFLTPKVFDRYEKIAKSGTGAIISEIFALDHRDRFYPYSTNMNYKGFFKDYKGSVFSSYPNIRVFAFSNSINYTSHDRNFDIYRVFF